MVSSLGGALSAAQLTPGMRQRAELRTFAKKNGTLTKNGEETLNALDRLDRQLESEKRAYKQAQKAQTSRHRFGSNAQGPGRAADSRDAASKAGSYENKATLLAQQAQNAAALGDRQTAARLRQEASQASLLAMQMRAEQAALSEKEAAQRAHKIAVQAEDAREKKRAEDKLREAQDAKKRRDQQTMKNSAREGLLHLENARKAQLKREKAESEALIKRVEHGQFWIRQMQLAQQNAHPVQTAAKAQFLAWQDAQAITESVPADLVSWPIPRTAHSMQSLTAPTATVAVATSVGRSLSLAA